MKTPTALSVTSSQREQTSLRFHVPRLPRSNVCSTRDLENPSASVHLKRFSTPSLTLKFLCAGKLNPRKIYQNNTETFFLFFRAYDAKRALRWTSRFTSAQPVIKRAGAASATPACILLHVCAFDGDHILEVGVFGGAVRNAVGIWWRDLR
jgi:hypothetical protein